MNLPRSRHCDNRWYMYECTVQLVVPNGSKWLVISGELFYMLSMLTLTNKEKIYSKDHWDPGPGVGKNQMSPVKWGWKILFWKKWKHFHCFRGGVWKTKIQLNGGAGWDKMRTIRSFWINGGMPVPTFFVCQCGCGDTTKTRWLGLSKMDANGLFSDDDNDGNYHVCCLVGIN